MIPEIKCHIADETNQTESTLEELPVLLHKSVFINICLYILSYLNCEFIPLLKSKVSKAHR
uniref:Uncharacterized protein n=1 Tax=Anguilla anguilla TaxID=7936 RepID=A0A0E9WCK5_ANGAN